MYVYIHAYTYIHSALLKEHTHTNTFEYKKNALSIYLTTFLSIYLSIHT